jgi:Rhodopirellula transposase DDE domain
LSTTDPALLEDLLALVSPSERGDPMSPLRWTCKGLRRLAGELRAIGSAAWLHLSAQKNMLVAPSCQSRILQICFYGRRISIAPVTPLLPIPPRECRCTWRSL